MTQIWETDWVEYLAAIVEDLRRFKLGSIFWWENKFAFKLRSMQLLLKGTGVYHSHLFPRNFWYVRVDPTITWSKIFKIYLNAIYIYSKYISHHADENRLQQLQSAAWVLTKTSGINASLAVVRSYIPSAVFVTFSDMILKLPSLKPRYHLKMDGWNTRFLLGRPIFQRLC